MFVDLYKVKIKNVDDVQKIYQKDLNSNLPKENKKIFYFNLNKIKRIKLNQKIIFDKIDFLEGKDMDKINFSELFYLSLLVEDKNFSFSLDYLKKINEISENQKLDPEQNIILAKIILTLLKNFDNNDEKEILTEIEKTKLDLINNIINNITEGVFSELKYYFKNIKNKSIEEIYSDIIIYLMKYIFDNKDKDKNEEIWNEIHLNLEEFIINKTIYSNINKFLNNNEKMKNFYNQIGIEKEPKLLKKIYDYISSKNSNKSVIFQLEQESLTEKGNKERERNDGGKLPNEKSEGLGNFIQNLKINLDELREILKYLKVEFDFEGNAKYFYAKKQNRINSKEKKKNTEPILEEIAGDFLSAEIDKDKEGTKNTGEKIISTDPTETEKKNFKQYQIFLETIKEYITKKKNEINFQGKKIYIILELIFKSEKQSENIHKFFSYIKNEINGLNNVQCEYSIVEEKEKDGKVVIEKKKKFRDDNILIFGINGNNQGFLHLMEEIINDDFE